MGLITIMAKAKKAKKGEEAQAGHLGDFGSAISALCEEKGISKDKVIETIEAALSAAYKKDYGKKGQNIKAVFDEKTGGTKFFLVKEVVDETLREFVTEEELAERAAQRELEKETGAVAKNEEATDDSDGRVCDVGKWTKCIHWKAGNSSR